MLSISVQPSIIKGRLTNHPSPLFKNFSSIPLTASFSANLRACNLLHSSPNLTPKITRTPRLRSAAAATEVAAPADLEFVPEPEVGVGVKSMGKPRMVLKFIWMEKNIGLALDQHIPGHGSVPLSPYFFWPRKDAWEELKATLETKPWISQKKMIILLNQATDIINLWQQSGGNFSS